MYLKLHLFGLVFFSFTLLNCQTKLDKQEPKITYKVNKSEEEWKTKGISETEIRRDVKVIMPSLDLFPKTK